MNTTHPASRIAFLIALAAPFMLAGCATVNYDRIHLGATPRDYEAVLPEDTSRRTALGLCHLSSTAGGRTDAIVVLLSSDRRVAGKMFAREIEQNWGLGAKHGYTLVGEIDPALYDVGHTGPIDTLRLITADLANYRGERLALDAHAWVVAGLVRLMQRWPGVEDVGIEPANLPEILDRVPGGGEAHIWVDTRGTCRFEYRQGAKP